MTTRTSIQVTAFAFTAYPVTDLARARAFYEGIFGLKPGMVWEGGGKGWIEYDLGDSTLALTNNGGEEWLPSQHGPGIAFEVADFDATVAALRAAHVSFTNEPMDFPSCRLALVRDPDGNRIALHHRKHST